MSFYKLRFQSRQYLILLGTVHYFYRRGAVRTRGQAPWTSANTSLIDCPSHNSKWTDTHAFKRVQRRGGSGGGAAAPSPFLMTRGEWALGGIFQLVEAWSLWWKWYKLRILYEIMWILPSETGFLGFLKHENPWASGGSAPWKPPVPRSNLWWK